MLVTRYCMCYHLEVDASASTAAVLSSTDEEEDGDGGQQRSPVSLIAHGDEWS